MKEVGSYVNEIAFCHTKSWGTKIKASNFFIFLYFWILNVSPLPLKQENARKKETVLCTPTPPQLCFYFFSFFLHLRLHLHLRLRLRPQHFVSLWLRTPARWLRNVLGRVYSFLSYLSLSFSLYVLCSYYGNTIFFFLKKKNYKKISFSFLFFPYCFCFC